MPRLLAVDYEVCAIDDSVLGIGGTDSGSAAPGASGDWAGFIGGAQRFVSASSRLSIATSQKDLRRCERAQLSFAPAIAIEPHKAGDRHDSVAIFLDANDGSAWRRVQEMGRAIMQQRRQLRLVVFGATLDDDGLRRTGAVTVTATPSEALARDVFALHRCVATIALIAPGTIEHPDLSIFAQSPRPLLSGNRHLPDVLGYRADESRWFPADQSAGAMLHALGEMLRDQHG